MNTKLVFRAWMVESAFLYIQAAKQLTNQISLMGVAEVNAAIGIEILLKSFNSATVSNEGEVNEKYRFSSNKYTGNGHDLLKLYKAIPLDIVSELGFHKYEMWIDTYKDLFVSSRYLYEETARDSHNDIIVEIGFEMVEAVINLYKKHGCTDPWILAYPNV